MRGIAKKTALAVDPGSEGLLIQQWPDSDSLRIGHSKEGLHDGRKVFEDLE